MPFEIAYTKPAKDPQATPLESKIAENYLRIRDVVMDGYPNACAVWLVIGNQYFPLSIELENKDEANFICRMAAKALAKLVAECSADMRPDSVFEAIQMVLDDDED